MTTLPESLISVIALPADPDIALMQPPANIVKDLLDAYQGGDLSAPATDWLEAQSGLQNQALEQLMRLSSTGELSDVTIKGLPLWITKEWAMILQMPWSHRLGEAVESAKSWM